MRFGRWYGNVLNHDGPTGKCQVDQQLRDLVHSGARLPEPLLRLAQDEYDRQYPGQPYERMQQRGGLSLLEVVGLLADSLERHGVRVEGVGAGLSSEQSDPTPSGLGCDDPTARVGPDRG